MPLDRRRARATVGLGLLLALAAATTGAAPPPAVRADTLWREGAALHVEGRHAAAIRRFHASLAIAPSARAHTWLAWSLSVLGDTHAAIAHCRASIRRDPDYPNAYNDLGSYLLDLGRPRAAERWLRRALAFEQYCCRHYAWYHLARSLLLQGRVGPALAALEASLAHRSNYRPAAQLLVLLRLLDLRSA